VLIITPDAHIYLLIINVCIYIGEWGDW